jgi:hypothetical protein
MRERRGSPVHEKCGIFDGSLDDVRIYNRALSATEVQQLYHLGTFKITSH